MKSHSPIIIEQAGNGFIVRPYCADNRMYSTNDIFVFNAMRHAPEAYEYAKRGSSLLAFVEQHFHVEPDDYVRQAHGTAQEEPT